LRNCDIRRARRKRAREETTYNYRRNRQNRVPQVVLIDQDNKNVGTVPTREALAMAEAAELDLVEIAPNSKPPVVRIMDYSKFIYEKKRKEREARKRQTKVEIKTIKLTLNTAEFHRGIQVKKARGWLEAGKKVKVVIRFFGREVTYPEIGYKIMAEIVEELKEISVVEQRAKMEGRNMGMMLVSNAEKQP